MATALLNKMLPVNPIRKKLKQKALADLASYIIHNHAVYGCFICLTKVIDLCGSLPHHTNSKTSRL